MYTDKMYILYMTIGTNILPAGRKFSEDTRLLVPVSTPAPLLYRCTGVSVSMQMTMLAHKMTVVILSKTNPVFIPTVFVLVPSTYAAIQTYQYMHSASHRIASHPSIYLI